MQIISNNYDLIFCSVIIISVILSLFRGGLLEILSLCAWFVALWLMHRYGNFVDKFITLKITNTLIRSVIIYFIFFIFIKIIFTIIKKIFSRAFTYLGLNGLDVFIGVVFGALRGVFICSIIIIIVEIFHIDDMHNWEKARSYLIIKPALFVILTAIPDTLKTITTTNSLKGII